MSKRLIDIIEIEVNKLYPHPKNPREDVGDVEELAESIKTKGIMQNLTVIIGGPGVPDGADGYTVIIGHRRRAAAIRAGLDTVPCAVVEMDEKEQISTMLLENMQRSDLTIYEQAQGIQMMIDLGESVKNISDKTGLSLSTIDRRRKLLSLDKDKFKESMSSGATLNDYLKISEIEDEKTRDRLLCFIGTNNFNYEYNSAVRKQKINKNNDRILSALPESVIVTKNYSNIPSYSNREEIKTFYPESNISDEDIGKAVEEVSKEGKFYCYYSDYSIALYKEKEADAEEVEEQKPQVDEESERKRREFEERREKLESLNSTLFNMRKEFFESFKATKQNLDKVIKFVGVTRKIDDWNEYDVSELCRLMDVDYSEPDDYEAFDIDDNICKVKECFDKNALQALYLQAYLCLDDSEDKKCYHYWDCEYYINSSLKIIYTGLEILGYELSDEEESYINGTHELFVGE